MRSSRLLLILLHLQVHGRTTAATLARRLEVSERTIYRDMDALSAAGVPVVADRGVGGGWYLLDEYRTNLTGLNEDEIRTLFMANSLQLLGDLGLQRAAEDALTKLLAALPGRQQQSAEAVRQRIHVDGTRWHATGDNLSWLSMLQEAIWKECKIELSYKRGDGETVTRQVDPLGLVAKGNVWYLVAGVEGEFRTYRVSRIQRVTLTDQPCLRPDGFDLAEHWEMSTAHFLASLPKYKATLRVDGAIVEWLRSIWRYAHIAHTDPPDAEGWQILHITCETEAEAVAYVLGCGPRAQVIDPPALCEKVTESVAAMARRLGGWSDQ
jgi:predicted DNA-binding transcriptional regulator YafY